MSKMLTGIKKVMFKTLSTTFFIFSLAFLLILASAFFIFLHFYINPKQIPITFQNYQPVTILPVSLTLDLSNPDDNLLVFDNNILVSGKTIPDGLVLVTVNGQNQLINASNQGFFSLTVKLVPTVNQLSVSSFDNLGNYKSEERTVFYSKEKL